MSDETKTTQPQPAQQSKAAPNRTVNTVDYSKFFDFAREFSAAELVTYRTVGRFAVTGFDGIDKLDPIEMFGINAYLNEGCDTVPIGGIESMVSYRLGRATKFIKNKERYIPEKLRMKMLLVLIEIASDPVSVQKSFTELSRLQRSSSGTAAAK